MKNILNIPFNTGPIYGCEQRVKVKKNMQNPLNWFSLPFKKYRYTQELQHLLLPECLYILGGSSTWDLFSSFCRNSINQKEPVIIINEVPGLSFVMPYDKADETAFAVLGKNCKINFFDNLLDNHIFKVVYFNQLKEAFADYDEVKDKIEKELTEKRNNGKSITTSDIKDAIDNHCFHQDLAFELKQELNAFILLEAYQFIGVEGANTFNIEDLIANYFSFYIDLMKFPDSERTTINLSLTKWFDKILTLKEEKNYRILSYFFSLQNSEQQYELQDIENKHIFGLMFSYPGKATADYFNHKKEITFMVSANGAEPSEYFSALQDYFPQFNEIDLKDSLGQSISKCPYLHQKDNQIQFAIPPHIYAQNKKDASDEDIDINYKKYLYQLYALDEKLYLESTLTNDISNTKSIKKNNRKI